MVITLKKQEITIINDAAWVGYEISLGLEEKGFKVNYLPRSKSGPNIKTNYIRSTYDKLFTPVKNAIKAKGIIHVNYALQDAFAVRLCGKTINVLHCHGTDLFGLLDEKFKKESKDMTKWSWVIKGNIKNAKKVIVSTPDLLPLAKQIREDAEYLPNPVDINRFSLKEFRADGLKAIGFNTWYERVPAELVTNLENNGIKVDIFERRPFSYNELHTILKKYDVYIDRIFTKGVNSYSKTCLEAMSCGLATIDYRHKDMLDNRANHLSSVKNIRNDGKQNRAFIVENHDREKIIKRLIEIYNVSEGN